MPSYLIKPDREENFYCYWSEIVEAPHCWGDREYVEAYMEKIGENAGDRWERTDETGSSAFPPFYKWGQGQGYIIYEQRGMLPLGHLKDFLESYDEETGHFDLSYLEPFDDETEVRGYE